MRIAFIGPPGAGKSTQARRISRSLPFHNHSSRFSTGDLVRAEIEAGTQIGREIRGHYERGERVPDETIFSLVLPRLRRSGGFMVDNLPATASPAAVLDEGLDPGPFERRNDDTEEATRAQLEAYRGEADALKTHYESRDALSVVDARRSLVQVTAEILDALGHPESPHFYALSDKG